MSKYQQRGDYHFQLYKTKGDPYREHVLDVMVQVEKHVPACCQVLDVGCGEGLVTYLLLESELGLGVVGCEIDGDAVALAATRNLPVEQVSFEDIDELHYEAILFLDSLEHVDDYVAVLEKAKRMTDILLIAVPDRHDPHATVQVGRQRIVDQFDLSWQMVHDETRHARHFMIFTKRHFMKIELPDVIAEAWLPREDTE
tara:strand:- start:6866 stop:7462 length:597 start_codon:yes stop_codon:yes gene_type:complete